ncbi:hypothetical protein GCM10011394_26220 [Luteimonas terricola]|uniref:Ubiquinone biosynthesis accessory factor UbiK n=2 Tax=Luteimonas terricola TaxID=645597 RepID=A0ABQ2ENY8_9GAMM|nr:hypothetical protein GCM10011394_26220 [Luteimonas terricola]
MQCAQHNAARHGRRAFPTRMRAPGRWRAARAAGTLTATPEDTPMIDLGHIDDLARRLSSLVPPGLREGREELQENFKSVLQAGLSRLDLVTREEFDVQRAVLLRTREKLEALQAQVAQLEAQLAGGSPAPPAAPQQPH